MSILNNINWKLIYRDTFDRETPPGIEKTGNGIKTAILCLWQYTLSEGVSKNGNRSFSAFNLTFEDSEALRNKERNYGFSLTDNCVNVWHSATALSKLRAYIYGFKDRTGGREAYIEKGGMLLNVLVEHHYDKLTKRSSSQDISTIKKIFVEKVNSQQELLEILIK